YELRDEGDVASGRAVLTIDVLLEGWSSIQIPAGLMVRDATLDGQRVTLVEGPPARVLLTRTGRSTLALDVAIAVAASAGAESMTTPASPSPISRVRLTLPRSGVDLAVQGGFVSDHSEAQAESRWTAFGRPHQAMAMTWKRKIDDRRAELPLRVRARVTEMVGLGE